MPHQSESEARREIVNNLSFELLVSAIRSGANVKDPDLVDSVIAQANKLLDTLAAPREQH